MVQIKRDWFDTAFEQMEETKNIFHKTGKRQVKGRAIM